MLDRTINNITIRSQNRNIKDGGKQSNSPYKKLMDDDILGTEMNFEELISVPFRSETKRMRNVIKTE